MKEDKVRKIVKEILDKKYFLEEIDELLNELRTIVSFPEVEGLFYTDHGHQYISDRLINYEKIKKENLTKEDLISMVDKIIDANGEEYEIDNLLFILTQAVKDPYVTDYIYYSDKELTATQIVEKACAYNE